MAFLKFLFAFVSGLFVRDLWRWLVVPFVLPILYRYYVRAWEEIERVWGKDQPEAGE